jgi:hypothetical protein
VSGVAFDADRRAVLVLAELGPSLSVPVHALGVELRVTDEVLFHVRRVYGRFGAFDRRRIETPVGDSSIRRPPEQQKLLGVAREVLGVVRTAAPPALDDGCARLELSTAEELYGPGGDYEPSWWSSRRSIPGRRGSWWRSTTETCGG